MALATVGALLVTTAVAEEGATPLSFNVGIASDYLFRGVSQTHGQPAVSAGVDYAHPSGFYVGAWAASISWVKDWLGKGSLEVDIYGGYKNTFGGGDWNYDVGYITYNYPGHGNASPGNLANPNTQELYAGIGYKWLSAKYSHATSDYFIGWYGGPFYDQKTRGSNYLELNANYDLGDGLTLVGHVGHQKVKNSVAVGTVNDANYNDWKIGVTKDIGLGVIGVAYSDTNTKGVCGQTQAANTSLYCWGTGGNSPVAPAANFRDVAKGAVVLSFTKSF